MEFSVQREYLKKKECVNFTIFAVAFGEGENANIKEKEMRSRFRAFGK